MWKQFLSKLPRNKSSSKSEHPHDTGSSHAAAAPTPTAAPKSSSAVKRMSSAIFPSTPTAGIEPLVPFKDVSNADKPNLFISKLNLCSAIFDFSDPNKNSAEKDMKRQALIDLIEFVTGGTARFTEPMISVSVKMFGVNLFREFPPNYRAGAGGSGEGEEDEPMFDPSWCHLQLVYDLLLKFIASSSLDPKVGKKFVDHSFILKLLELFDSEDPRERDCLKTILHRIYGKFMVHRPFVRKAVSNIFYRFVFETERHNGIAELLEVFGSVITGFAQPLKEEHKMFLTKVLVPLHKPKSVGMYLQQLIYCITQFLEKDPKLAGMVIGGLLKYWPVTNSQKEVMFLSELEEVLDSTSATEFQKCMVPLFRRVALCLNSSHFQVSERALLLWNNDHVISLVAQNRQAVMPLVVPALERNARNHWNQAVTNLTMNVRKMLSEMDDDLFLECQKKFEETEEQSASMEEKRRTTWERLEIAGSFHPVTGNTAGKKAGLFRPALPSPTIATTK